MDQVMRRVGQLLDACAGPTGLFPRTALFNETWLLRLALEWFSRSATVGEAFGFSPGATWFSEALLPSPFLARHRGDKLAESWTHADAVIGQFTIGNTGRGDLCLTPNASQFVVIESKLFSRLSSSVKNASYYDQAARNVACMGEVLRRAGGIQGREIDLKFVLVAPAAQVRAGVFGDAMTPASISRKVRRRADDYAGERDQWYAGSFEPLMPRLKLPIVAWEDVVATIASADPGYGAQFGEFYRRCLEYNGRATIGRCGPRPGPVPPAPVS